ncbi:cysteine peptidase family C39 domain-containing protein [bacterium]|nr:cysteine peptidase family C39 domain-containing protein [bacterium]
MSAERLKKRCKKIRYVDGFRIRNTYPDFDIIESAATCSPKRSHGMPFIPKGEIWIDERYKKEVDFLLKIHHIEVKKKNWSEARLREYLKKRLLPKKKALPQVALGMQKHQTLNVCFVRGSLVRKHFDPWFIHGGHDLCYSFIPKNNIWLDAANHPRDVYYTLIHELEERKWMRQGLPYQKAHERATLKEARYRKKEFRMPLHKSPYLKLSKQKNGNYCGPASLKIIFDFFGREYEEKTIAELCRSTKHGTDHKDMAACARILGASVFEKKNASMRDLKRYVMGKRLPVVVGWWEDFKYKNKNWNGVKITAKNDEGHYSVICRVTKHFVYLLDPWLCEVRKMPIHQFMEKWWDADTSQFIKVKRWMMAPYFKTNKINNLNKT